MNTIPPIAYVLAGIAVLVFMARLAPRAAGWVLLALVIGILLTAQRKGAFQA